LGKPRDGSAVQGLFSFRQRAGGEVAAGTAFAHETSAASAHRPWHRADGL